MNFVQGDLTLNALPHNIINCIEFSICFFVCFGFYAKSNEIN